ncbi:L-threonylcarbamoyladenylate synthase [Amaricoccus sp.]|uniref:L-threonylcarbamoyladenylate synthase n=1 Tax=Amaricoccus sp. TaxID=1872485 RepID=UPI001B4037CA|nr:L-threonylcarbamoyladenylate synthase [Amaricoccus sp.]MBP7000460.1 threonylcarbamoyl-AMP synthase [Amaricoccus sp.]
MTDRNAVLLPADPDGVRAAAHLLAAGALVAFPTETVYGLGADARSDRAVAGIFAAKGRPAFNPLIVHVAGVAAAAPLAELGPEALALAERFWPGPLTLVVPRRPDAGLAAAVTAGLGSVALRAPAHPLARALLDAFGGPLAGPSANPSGTVSPTTAAHVLEGLGGRIAAVLDGGPCPVGVESTIVGLADGAPRLLRPGGLPVEAIEAALGRPLAGAGQGITAPGQLASHYAPRAALRLGAAAPEPDEAWLGFGPGPVGDPGLNLSEAGDLDEAAARLFACLRDLDALAAAAGRARIAVARIPEAGLGRAINDRLRRAAAPRG